MSTIAEQIKKLPEAPGVYFFIGAKAKILYIGKATSLRDRVASYFRADLAESRSPLIMQMIPLIKKIDFRQTDSTLEALLLEADLIKKFRPEHNTKEKDDKSYNCVVVTKEAFPRVLVIRQKNIDSHKLSTSNFQLKNLFGPFPQGSSLREALKIIRKIFPFRDTCVPYEELDEKKKLIAKPCFNYQIGLCPGVCIGAISKDEYAKNIHRLELFFKGGKAEIVIGLEKEMKVFAKAEEFEKAEEAKRKIFALNHIHDVSLMRHDVLGQGSGARIESYDIAHTSGVETVGVMTVVEDGLPNKAEYRKFKIKTETRGSDVAALKELLTRRLGHVEWPMPKIIVVDGGVAQKNLFESILAAEKIDIPVVSVVKDARHKPDHILGDEKIVHDFKKEILLANSESHRFAIGFHRARRGRGFRGLPL